jgi:hypothetical protein
MTPVLVRHRIADAGMKVSKYMNLEGQARDLAHRCSRLCGPSRLGNNESSWALGSPYLHRWPFGTYWWCCVSLSYPSLDGESRPADRPYRHLP